MRKVLGSARQFVPIVAAVGLTLMAPACAAQAPAPTPNPAPPFDETRTWADTQRSQAFATRKLEVSPRRHQWVSIQEGGRTLRAFVTFPQTKTPVPVVIVTHEVFGLTDSTRSTADQIAALGYITVAPDMVSGFGPGGGNVDSFRSSHATGEFMTVIPDETVNSAFDAVAAYAIALPGANGKLAMVGLSWGGGATFRYVASGHHDPHLKLAAIFYDVGPPAVTQGPEKFGKNNPPMSVSSVDVPIHGFYPSNDTRVMKSLPATRDAMAAAGKSYDPVIYEGADHAYMRVGEDPADPNPANAKAVKASMDRLRSLLAAM